MEPTKGSEERKREGGEGEEKEEKVLHRSLSSSRLNISKILLKSSSKKTLRSSRRHEPLKASCQCKDQLSCKCSSSKECATSYRNKIKEKYTYSFRLLGKGRCKKSPNKFKREKLQLHNSPRLTPSDHSSGPDKEEEIKKLESLNESQLSSIHHPESPVHYQSSLDVPRVRTTETHQEEFNMSAQNPMSEYDPNDQTFSIYLATQEEADAFNEVKRRPSEEQKSLNFISQSLPIEETKQNETGQSPELSISQKRLTGDQENLQSPCDSGDYSRLDSNDLADEIETKLQASKVKTLGL
ncbi:unnamed protein product [Moneuplotes crassus]|uniref:Uncharacterized protein n=1 Tax=Euplotes crassus TaxID=5936 RepID=A0AAD1Y6P8_EUPCR|nr:unnamed protein product [Moneuplotes crassus]